MIIGNVSIDPRTVLDFEYDRRTKSIEIDVRTGDALRTITALFDDSEQAWEMAIRLDKACYKGPLADAVSDKSVDDDDDDDISITDALIEATR
jgi:hypothetical protein